MLGYIKFFIRTVLASCALTKGQHYSALESNVTCSHVRPLPWELNNGTKTRFINILSIWNMKYFLIECTFLFLSHKFFHVKNWIVTQYLKSKSCFIIKTIQCLEVWALCGEWSDLILGSPCFESCHWIHNASRIWRQILTLGRPKHTWKSLNRIEAS